jgi:hypothetical protein
LKKRLEAQNRFTIRRKMGAKVDAAITLLTHPSESHTFRNTGSLLNSFVKSRSQRLRFGKSDGFVLSPALSCK